METPLLIHHITDIHVGSLHYRPVIDQTFIPQNQVPLNLYRYLDYISSLNSKNKFDTLPDLLIISGDLTSYAHEDEMNQVEDVIKQIKEHLLKKKNVWHENNKSPYILLVPGNHDLDWSKEDYGDKIERYARMSDLLYDDGKVLSAAYHSIKGSVSWDFGDTCNLFVQLFNTTSLGGSKDPRIKKIYDDLHELLRNKNLDLKDIEKEMLKDPGYIDPEDLNKMERKLNDVPLHRFKIAVMHHNPSSVPSYNVDRFDTAIYAGLLKEFLMKHGFDMVFHGHRHIMHCCHERFIGRLQSKNGIFILGGDSLGEKENAPFLEVLVHGIGNVHENMFPARLFTVSSVTYSNTSYRKDKFIEEIIDRQICGAFGSFLKGLGRNIPSKEEDWKERKLLQESLKMIQPYFHDLQSGLFDWGEDSDDWIKKFHIDLNKYRYIYATDVYHRSSVKSPKFEKYLREQYAARERNLKSSSDQCLVFSKPVYDAIMYTGWEPDPIQWSNNQIKPTSNNSEEILEIVRILIRPPATLYDIHDLNNLNFDHKSFAIPLFVLNSHDMKQNELLDFAIGFEKTGEIRRCYEFIEKDGKVKEAREERRVVLIDLFENMLKNPLLRTADQFLGQGIMIKDPEKAKAFAENYDKSRGVSTKLFNKLKELLNPGPDKIGLDIGCGTGNYTIPFINDFGKVYGLDIDKWMLDIAKKKSDRVEWIERNALKTGLDDESCDAVWLISTLHYFSEERQKLLFEEIHRILKPGGVVVADTEFEEQHESLWVVEFFSSLKDRYKGKLLSKEKYYALLGTKFKVDHAWLSYADIKEEAFKEKDVGIRIGQHFPELYLSSEKREVIPAFKVMQPSELEEGLTKLRKAIRDGTINDKIAGYKQKAKMKGDIGIIIAIRQ